MAAEVPLRFVHALAPLRVNDIGGWTDTWFSRKGRVLNIAVGPPVEVQIKAFKKTRAMKRRVLIQAENFGKSFRFDPDRPSRRPHPLLQAAVGMLPPPDDVRLEVRLFSPVPAGISAGTSASVCVALLGALAHISGSPTTPLQTARLAHRVETESLGLQCGIQDQVCAALGGICFIDIRGYPKFRAERLALRDEVLNELGRRLLVVYLGKPHRSSDLHQKVISRLERGGAEYSILEKLSGLAERARAFLEKGDLESYGRTMTENNEYQRALYSGLVSPAADAVAAMARERGASGWKVNGAGGQGGSITLLAGPDDGQRRDLARRIRSVGRGVKIFPLSLFPSGLRTWDVSAGRGR